MPYKRWNITIQHNPTKKIIQFPYEYGNGEDSVFIWEEGNYACDCNRALFFYRAQNLSEKEIDCGTGKFSIKIENHNQKIIYTEL